MKSGETRSVNWRWAAAFIALAALAESVLLGIRNYWLFVASNGHVISADYSIFRFASVLFWRGDWATLFDPALFIAAHARFDDAPPVIAAFPYPPSGVWFILPLAALPNFPGLFLWLALTFAAFAWAICRRHGRWPAAALALLLAPGSLINISYGQNGFLAAALLCGGLLLLEESPLLAGLLIGLLSFKPQLGLLLPFVLIAGGHYRALIAAAITTAVLLLASLWLFGTSGWMEYISGTMAMQRSTLQSATGAMVMTMPSVLVAGRMLDLPLAVDYGLQAAAGLLAVGGAVWAFRRRSVALPVKAAVVMVGAFLASPYFSTSDLCILAAAQVILLSRYRALSPMEYALHALIWVLPMLTAALGPAHIPLGSMILLAFFGLLLKRLASEENTASPGARLAAPLPADRAAP